MNPFLGHILKSYSHFFLGRTAGKSPTPPWKFCSFHMRHIEWVHNREIKEISTGHWCINGKSFILTDFFGEILNGIYKKIPFWSEPCYHPVSSNVPFTLGTSANDDLWCQPLNRWTGKQQRRSDTSVSIIAIQNLVGGMPTPLKNMKVNWDD